jgi:hypothetical protein
MTGSTDTARLAAFGLAGARVGHPEPLPRAADESAQGAIPEALLAVALLAGGSAEFHPVSSSAAESAALRLSVGDGDARGLWRLRTTDQCPLSGVRTTRGARHEPGQAPSAAVAFDVADATVVYVGAGEGALLVERADGLGLLLDFEQRELCVVDAALQVAPFATVAAPDALWAAARADPWLAAACRARAAGGDAYDVAAAVALLERAARTSAADVAALERFLAEDDDAPVAPDPVRAWVRGLDAARVETIADLARAQAEQWQVRVEGLAEDLAFADRGWLAELRAFLHARDDLEGVCRLLFEVGAQAPLRATLQALDETARPFVAALPRGLFAGDERLQRAAADPGAWWTEPAEG